MPLSQITTRPHGFSPSLMTEMQHALPDREDDIVDHLARTLGEASNDLQRGDAVPFSAWPFEQQRQTVWAARYAVRLLEPRARRDALYHATARLALARYGTTAVRLLTPAQIRQCYHDAKVVLDEFWGRMTDHSFRYLDGDTRARIDQAAKE